jgi:hypothetical protein
LPYLVEFLPDTSDAHDRVKELWDRADPGERHGEEWKGVREWLMFRSLYLRDELVEIARAARDEEGWVEGTDELEALARLDWAAATPILLAHEVGTHQRTAALAMSLLYRKAVRERASGEAESYRDKLRSIVRDQDAPGRSRKTAFDALMETEWSGRDVWYLSLFGDESLLELHEKYSLMRPLTGPVSRDPDRWIPVIARMVGHENRAVHDTAVSCLIQFHLRRAREDALRPLIPWLMDRTWSSAPDRLRLIQSMDLLDLPESVPGLIHVVANESDPSLRSYAADSLEKYADPTAVTALRAALGREPDENHRRRIIGALIASGGLGDADAVDALEAVATQLTTKAGRQRIYGASSSFGEDPLPIPVSIGLYLRRMGPPSETMVETALARVQALEAQRLKPASEMLKIIHTWRSSSAYRDIVRRIGSGSATAGTIRSALQVREEFQKSVRGPLENLLRGGGEQRGVASVLLNARDAQHLVLAGGGDEEAQRALLACARLVREPLPLSAVGRLLQSRGPALREAAERYLISEDSPEARALVQAIHPGDALILGRRQGHDPGHNTYRRFDESEEVLRDEVKSEDGPDEIVAMLSAGYWGDHGQFAIRRWPERTELRYDRDEARYYGRELSEAEWNDLTDFLVQRNFDNLPPLIASVFDGIQYEYVRVSRDGGRRVFMNNPEDDTVYGLLVSRFFGLLRRGELDVEYRLAQEIGGLEVLWTDAQQPIGAVWASNNDVRVLVPDDDGLPLEWRVWSPEGIGRVVGEPSDVPILNTSTDVPRGMDDLSESNGSGWQVSAGRYRIRTGTWRDTDGLWQCRKGEEPLLIREGEYSHPIVTPDGRWVIAALQTSGPEPNPIVRIDLETSKEFPTQLDGDSSLLPQAYVEAHRRVLLAETEDEDNEAGFFLLDPETGMVTSVSGQFGPLLDQTVRPLQPTARNNVFWATVVDHVERRTSLGLYDTLDFGFQVVMMLPNIRVSSMNIWVDESTEAVWMAYDGHLLRFPLSLER